MAATLLRTRLALAPKLCRSLCQATNNGVSRRCRPRTPAFFIDISKPDWCLPLLCINKGDTPHCMFVSLNGYGPGPPDLYSCRYFLRNLLRDKRKPKIARPFFAIMLMYGSIPDVSMFSLLVKSHCKQLTYQDVLDVVFLQMKAMGVKPDDSFYRILMYCVCAHFGPNVGYHLLKKLRSTHPFELPLSCYNPIVHRFCEGKMVEDEATSLVIVDVLMDLKQQGVFADEKIYKYMLKGRVHGGEPFLKPAGIGRQMFAQGIRIGAVFAANLLNKDVCKGQ